MEKLTSILLIAEGVESGTKILEKTILLARRFGARVELLLAEPRDLKAFAAVCAARGFEEVVLCSVHRGPESLNDLILRRVFERSPDLVVKAPAGGHPAGPGAFAPDDQQLALACPVPLILMREHPWRSPVRIAAAVDVSGEDAALARSIVHTAGFLNLGFEGQLDVLYSEREQEDEVLRMARAVKLARLVREFHVAGDHLRHVDGAPETTLPPIAASGDYDILIFGALTHHEGFSALRANLTRKLVTAFNGDIVLVKKTAHATVEEPTAPLRSLAMS